MATTLNVAVLLGDPRLPYSYSPDNKFGQDELEAAAQLGEALERIEGYTFHILDDHERLLDVLPKLHPDLVLNLCDTGFRNDWQHTHNVPALLEVLGIPYTGAPAAGIVLSDDKALVSAAARLRGVPVPAQTFIELDVDEPRLPERYPALIKPNLGQGSFGVSARSVVEDAAQAMALYEELRPQLDVPEVLAQEFMPGAELTVGLVGNPRTGFVALPPLEVDYSALDPSLPPILTHGSKADPDSPYWQALRFKQADLADAHHSAIMRHCQRMFDRLHLRDYARFDFRFDAEGEPRLIDANCNPTWYQNGKMALMASWAGLDYPAFLRLILEAAEARHGLRQASTGAD